MVHNMPIRYFTYTEEGEEEEITMETFENLVSHGMRVEYERHTVHANGVRQVCLTASPYV